ncbi:MAG: hypothetical protein M1813_007565 [Trichoglossum hirsutum]|nr:MAG: hypothetical protein M1813_007565 [Trichoglossum hirsutum]
MTEEPVGNATSPPTKGPSGPVLDRSGRQLGLFLAGAGFFALSTYITRRALVRRYKASLPAFYQPNYRPNTVNGAMESFEALNIATINVTSFAMMATGGVLYAFDISSLADLRRKVRGGMGIDDGTGRSEKDAEEEFEEWLAGVLARKSEKESRERDAQRKEGQMSRASECRDSAPPLLPHKGR